MSATPPQTLIAAKRDGGTLSVAEIEAIAQGIASESWSEAQVAAFAMAVFLRGLDRGEQVALTRAMTASGAALDWTDLRDGRPIVDKHSTGGIGDKVSLILAPALAACGCVVPMLSGRGLGHTGGTLDKLESIPGYRCDVPTDQLQRICMEVGCAIVGASADLVPADRRLYAIRDVTATVASLPLIVSSILSKKLAEGLDALVLDVKTGSGAFMVGRAAALELAEALVAVANGAGLPTMARVTDMNQVLGRTAGNALEVGECIAMMRGEPGDERLMRVTSALGGAVLARVGVADSADEGAARIERAITDGLAAERFGRMVAALGGSADLVEDPDAFLPRAPVVRPAVAARAGHVRSIDLQALGMAIVGLGGGRTRPNAPIDPRVGLTDVVAPGDRVDRGQPLATIHAAGEDGWRLAAIQVAAAVVIGDEAPEPAGDAVIEAVEAAA
ncbi:MAG: thymidine phosphorylase [Alphaproteobacteria bacterium]